jgi:hypothetical protein
MKTVNAELIEQAGINEDTCQGKQNNLLCK